MGREEKIQRIIDCKNEIDNLIHQNYHTIAKKNNLTLEQFHLLIELDDLMLDIPAEHEGPTVGEIAKTINNSQNTVSERITRLEKKGLVIRVRDQNDRRISRVLLTGEGRDFIKTIDKQANSHFLLNSLSKMKDTDIENLERCLKTLINLMKC